MSSSGSVDSVRVATWSPPKGEPFLGPRHPLDGTYESHFIYEHGSGKQTPTSAGALLQPQGNFQHPYEPKIPQRETTFVPPDVASYIMQLEAQNDDLRLRLEDMQKRPSTTHEESKHIFLQEVLQQVESIIEAHRSKSNIEIARYKAEAEEARTVATNLRGAIQSSGLDLHMSPALIQFHRKQTELASSGASCHPGTLGLILPMETLSLLDQLAEELLNKLLAVNDQHELAETVRQSVKSSFESIVLHFTDALVSNVRVLEERVTTLQGNLDKSHEETRSVAMQADAAKLRLVSEHAVELSALQDQLQVYQRAACAGDAAVGKLHDRAFSEYNQLLSVARKEAAHWKHEVENEKNHAARVILQLKSELQQRTKEFEIKIARRADDLVQERDRRIAELEAIVIEAHKQQITPSIDCGTQAGEPMVHFPSLNAFVPAAITAANKDILAAGRGKELFDQDVWLKTRELLAKYGAQS